MAGGIYNPFGFGGGEAPQAVPRRMPQDIPAAPFGFAPPPSKWDRVKQALWETNLAAPIRGYYNLINADPYTLYTDTGAAGQQAATDSFDAAGGVTAGSAMIPKPRNALMMGLKLQHGSPRQGLTELLPGPEGTGALGPGVYGTPAANVAQRYGDNVYSFEAPDEMFLGSGSTWDEIPSSISKFQVWRDQIAKLAEANPEHADLIKTAGDKMVYDGYPFFRELAYKLGSKEKAQEVFKNAGYKGFTAMVDGPEAVLFDPVPIGAKGN